MSKQITIENLSTNEKIELMEKLWEDLSSSPDYSPPEWHGEELVRRKNAVEEGKETYTDWNKAKDEIRQKINLERILLQKLLYLYILKQVPRLMILCPISSAAFPFRPIQ